MFSLAICIDVVVAGGGGGDKTDAATWNRLAPLSMFELFAFREGEGPFVCFFCFDRHLGKHDAIFIFLLFALVDHDIHAYTS